MPSAAELLAARRRRVTAIRRRVIAAVAASFVLFWGAVAWDGSMGAETPTTAANATATRSAAPSETGPDTATTTQQDDGSSLSTAQS
jgi:hypothetical protein